MLNIKSVDNCLMPLAEIEKGLLFNGIFTKVTPKTGTKVFPAVRRLSRIRVSRKTLTYFDFITLHPPPVSNITLAG